MGLVWTRCLYWCHILWLYRSFLGEEVVVYHYSIPLFLKKVQNSLDWYHNTIKSGSWVEDNTRVQCRYWFGVILNLLTHEFWMYDQSLLFLFGSTNIYRGVFYQIYLLPCLTINDFIFLSLVLWNYCDIVVGFWIASPSLSG